jgi:aldose 1-epimerase
MAVTKQAFGTLSTGEAVSRYLLSNGSVQVGVLDYGCIIQSILVPDRKGKSVDVVLGYDDAAAYEAGSSFFGAFVGRYANRIAHSRFLLNGKPVLLTPNEGENHLHGVLANCLYEAQCGENSVTFRRRSPAGEEGYPGALDIAVTYSLGADNALRLDYRVTSDADTVLNLTNHSYFNLSGHDSGDMGDQILRISADAITPLGPGSIPTGELMSVEGTPFDFRAPKAIGRDIGADHEQIRLGTGYDHNFVLSAPGLERPFAVAESAKTGIVLECFTTQPGVQLYTGNFVQDDAARGRGKGGAAYGNRSAFCLETQHYPDSPNKPQFPSTLLRAGEEYHEVTVYRFRTRR